ncbi:hypothetical protein PSPO01_15185 [Paraphaeosphaeria sporulosa]
MRSQRTFWQPLTKWHPYGLRPSKTTVDTPPA